jgi:hypothetical protein
VRPIELYEKTECGSPTALSGKFERQLTPKHVRLSPPASHPASNVKDALRHNGIVDVVLSFYQPTF